MQLLLLAHAVTREACHAAPARGRRSFVSLGFITCGAIGYVLTDKGFEVRAYMWVSM